MLHIIARHPVIPIHTCDIGPLRHVQCRVPGIGQSSILLVEDPNMRILRRVLVTKGTASIGGTIVYQNDLQIPIGLPQKAVHTAAHIGLDVIDRNDDTDPRFHLVLLHCKRLS